jgi:hypothetical protein
LGESRGWQLTVLDKPEGIMELEQEIAALEGVLASQVEWEERLHAVNAELSR